MQCKLPNFGKLDEIGVPAEILELQNFDDMVKAIMEFLEKNTTNFSLSEEGSLSPEKIKIGILGVFSMFFFLFKYILPLNNS